MPDFLVPEADDVEIAAEDSKNALVRCDKMNLKAALVDGAAVVFPPGGSALVYEEDTGMWRESNLSFAHTEKRMESSERKMSFSMLDVHGRLDIPSDKPLKSSDLIEFMISVINKT